MTQAGGNDYTVTQLGNLNIGMPLVAGTKLPTTSLLLTVREELWVTQHCYPLAVVDEGNGS